MAIFELGDDPDTFDRTIALPHPLRRIHDRPGIPIPGRNP